MKYSKAKSAARCLKKVARRAGNAISVRVVTISGQPVRKRKGFVGPKGWKVQWKSTDSYAQPWAKRWQDA